MVEDIDPYTIGIANHGPTDISDAELGPTGYVMFRRNRIGRGERVILYIKKCIQVSWMLSGTPS